ncbi:TetR/AcrR family transcriptional regulator [Cytobacillus firmus]|jgi:AcrR family transcriptional regulator|uniref:TetR/AcrR family transcriptional regulator n=3 Tax=Bacillales TaxID=1385 RepID=A0AA46NZW3_CYTFI|nr:MULTISPECIES: TetR/AcrR family transcriptional regulator [Bacillaceae]EWG12191.1 TetR family transcriptional regulator [Cytobacillus firmus DS1]KML42093.1 TetR family transcriptional regulator [Cytobacillus firmus]MBG9444073.1 TetR family transcriptional regulator [Cytobacillus firmus]MBG9588121.1 TetR family transcriptional regulator [Cytobacillus firmus]MBY6054299.1 TetR/AcrR family transcriptional regulator [Cytobacillus firmus]
MKKREVQASVKDERLVKKRRDQMIKGAVTLFIQKGFHRTTTREIAKASGFSIGTLYEYIRTKEDVLYLVCDSIYDQVAERLQKGLDTKQGTLESLKQGIADYFKVVDEMQDEVLVMYQEVKALTKDALPYVLKKEIEMVGMFEHVITLCVENGELDLPEEKIKMIAHNIFVQGQMWAFRRWSLQKMYSIEEYIQLQTNLLFQGIKDSGKVSEKA